MSVDPTPPSDQLPRGSTEAVRAGTKTKFNFVPLVIGLILIIAIFGIIYVMTADGRQAVEADRGQTPADAAAFDTPVSPAKGDSPVEGDAVDAVNTRKDGPSDPTPSTN